MDTYLRNMGLALDGLVDYVVNTTILEFYHTALHDPCQNLLVGQQPFAGRIIFGIGAALNIMSQ